MQLRGILIAVLALATLGGAAWWSQRSEAQKEAAGTTVGDTPKLSLLKEAEIDRIVIRHLGSLATVVQRGDAGGWTLTAPQNLRADNEAASAMAASLSNLTWDRLVEEKPTDLAPFGLITPSLDILASSKAGKTQHLLIGDEVPTGGNFFAKFEGDPRVWSLPSGTKSALDKTDKDLRDKRLLTFDTEKLTTFTYNAIEFTKAGGDWRITKPRSARADGYQVEELLRKLKEAKLDPGVPSEDANFAGGTLVAAIQINTETLQVRKKGTDVYARSSVVPGAHKLSPETGAGLGKSLEDFRSKKIFDFGFSEPNKVEIRDGGKTHLFAKSGDKWVSGGKALDPIGIQSLVDRLRDLSAAKFVDSGFASPALTISVDSNDGKRSETVELTKTASAYVAKRSNETELYQLDLKAIEDLLRAAADVKEPPKPPAR